MNWFFWRKYSILDLRWFVGIVKFRRLNIIWLDSIHHEYSVVVDFRFFVYIFFEWSCFNHREYRIWTKFGKKNWLKHLSTYYYKSFVFYSNFWVLTWFQGILKNFRRTYSTDHLDKSLLQQLNISMNNR